MKKPMIYTTLADRSSHHCTLYGRAIKRLKMYQAVRLAWYHGYQFCLDHPKITASGLYNFSLHLAMSQGLKFGSPHCGFQLKGMKPTGIAGMDETFLIQPGNKTILRMHDNGSSKAIWLYRISFVHPETAVDAWFQKIIVL